MDKSETRQLDIEAAIDQSLSSTKSGMIMIEKANAAYYALTLDSLKLSMLVDQTHQMAVLGHIILVLRGEKDELVLSVQGVDEKG